VDIVKNTNFDFLGKKWPFITLSLVLTAAGLASLVVKGGPAYGIDFRGGTEIDVRLAIPPAAAVLQRIRSALSSRISGEVSVIGVQGENEVMIGTELSDERMLEMVRKHIVEALQATFGQSAAKPDFNTISRQALMERLRDPLVNAGIGLSEPELQSLVRSILEYRDTPPRSGLVRSLDELASVPGVTPAIAKVIKSELSLGQFAVRSVSVVGPKIGGELRQKAVYTVLAALGGMLVYIAWRFEWIYGVAAVIAVFHDTIITLGLFSLINEEISLTVVAALLTLVGYSMNDTIVVFDRIRENLKIRRRDNFESLINTSINQTLGRTILTSGLTLVTAVALLLFGGRVLHGFSLALVIGIIVGTYSSVFIASPILIWGHSFADRHKKTGRA
jgi:preprotein translocase subunit SecF